MKFELDEKQVEKLKEWQEAIKKVFGSYGEYEFIFKPTGIGDVVKVYSCLSKATLDLTDVDKW